MIYLALEARRGDVVIGIFIEEACSRSNVLLKSGAPFSDVVQKSQEFAHILETKGLRIFSR